MKLLNFRIGKGVSEPYSGFRVKNEVSSVSHSAVLIEKVTDISASSIRDSFERTERMDDCEDALSISGEGDGVEDTGEEDGIEFPPLGDNV